MLSSYPPQVHITYENILKLLDEKPMQMTKIHDQPEVGIINGLYATSSGVGGIVPIQIKNNYSSDSSFAFKLTGSLGDVMKESIQCAFTMAVNYIKDNNLLTDIQALINTMIINQDNQQHLMNNIRNRIFVMNNPNATYNNNPNATNVRG